MSKSQSWFEVDKVGLSTKADKVQALVEVALSNTFDQAVREVKVALIPKRGGTYTFVVEDDDPDGFKDLTHAYTLFAPSEKVDSPTKRGRFNLGEKLLLSLASEATITSTTGTVHFNSDGTRTITRSKTAAGTTVTAIIRLTKDEAADFADLLHQAIVPDDIVLTYNGEKIKQRKPLITFKETLPTVIGENLRPSRRTAQVALYERAGDRSLIYELGIPVVEVDLPWDVDIAQKVPLSFSRDSVKPSYERELKSVVLANGYRLLEPEDAKESWVTDALADAPPEVVREVVTQRYGDRAVIADPSDREATKRALDGGYNVVHGASLPRHVWDAIKSAEALQPAGKIEALRSGVPVSGDEKKAIPEKDWKPAERAVVIYAKRLGEFLLGFEPAVEIVSHTPFDGGKAGRSEAWWGGRTLTFNRGVLGRDWFSTATLEMIDALLIHEFAHEAVSDHLSDRFSDECCRLGAKLHGPRGALPPWFDRDGSD